MPVEVKMTMIHSVDDVPARAPDGQPLCRGYDWTEPAWVPSDLTEERQVGQCSWLESVVDYDDAGDPYEDHISHEIQYFVRPDGSAQIVRIEDRWGSDLSRSCEILEPGTWKVAYFPLWPRDFGSRSGVQIVLEPRTARDGCDYYTRTNQCHSGSSMASARPHGDVHMCVY